MRNRIKQIRKNHNLTQIQLADSVNVSRQTIIAIEKGKYIPSLLLAMKIAKYFDLKIENIFFEEE
ncbi:helix-turn-helix transcriptional regulator [Peribacillus sp. TH24]|uniref:helix-turn-helix transcriptional regulator n=1 Tax=Peribacillus sp. TH24 TaxID=2798483 RepID=UPI00191489E5|nr:helix-turn-helix transcriptional regulator [Peribacillus sp. TH24]MBK5446077.1 helix-turn-helix transcriptional regulator [Peribacillus sp. TH24]